MKLEPATDAAQTIARYRAHVSEGMAMLAELMEAHVEVRSEGTRIWDEAGTEYLDCGGYGVFILGHRYPRVVAAVRDQLDRHPMSSRVLLNGELAHAAEQLARVAPDGLEYVFFTNSGAEAAELAIKLARVNGRRRLISTHGGFHGKTNGALSVTGKAMFRDPFQPGLADVSFVAFDDVDALEAELAAGDRAAVILEPIQAEGGVIIPADGYLQAVRELCDRHGALLILDEVQTGLGRLGSWWGADRAGVVPDILLVGKGLSGGVVPVAAVVATPDAYRTISEDPLLHSSTYAGNPLAMSAASAAITALEEDDIIPRARALGARLLDELLALKRGSCSDGARRRARVRATARVRVPRGPFRRRLRARAPEQAGDRLHVSERQPCGAFASRGDHGRGRHRMAPARAAGKRRRRRGALRRRVQCVAPR